ncbi:unnamed protein product [Candidula unifasciata]|uniref:Uncharacterized protein n=1 Tax=Candidula unifasciata TaxID=100452 RepID=A0A8S3YYJ9_9EUPU|nr:unnamed protein product [Candidula unifasciata]
MSQQSGGLPEISVITFTQNAASAFGDDIADDSYSVSELSHYTEDKAKHRSKSISHHETFGRSTLRKLERQMSIQQESQSSQEADTEVKERKSSSGSPDQIDEVAGRAAESDVSDMNITSFVKFGQTKFQMKILPSYSCSALPQPLLPKPDRADYLASLASWVTILRIMGDLPGVDMGDTLVIAGTHVPVTSKVRSAFKAKYTKKDIDDAHKKYSDLFKDPTGTDAESLPFLSAATDSMLDKVQLVCAMGIYKPVLRDELYCQLCKQLTNNPSRNSIMRGWVLLNLFAGSFSPSENFAHILVNFLRDSPSELSEKVDKLLRRTFSVGTRAYPLSWLEFQAAKNGKPLLIPVTFMSGHRMLFEVDSAMTVAEVIRNVGERVGLKETSGYSIYISLHTKISCLGHGQHRIMDAISECEQQTKQMGMRESSTVWRIYFRREYFSPWYIPGEDVADTDLVYQQVRRGITMGEYRPEKEETLLNLTAKFYYIEYPDDLGYYNMTRFIDSFIPASKLSKRPNDYFQVNLKLGTEKPPIHTIKTEIVKFAKDTFYILFSRYYDVAKVMGPNLNITEVVVGVNNQGIYVVDNTDTLRLQVEFSEIVDITKTKHHLTLGIANMDDFVFSTNHSDDFYHTVSTNIDELKKRSTVAIAKEDFTHLDSAADVTVLKGDLLELSQCLADLGDNDMVTALCTRTKKPCDIPVKLLYTIATVDKPSDALIERLTIQICKNAVGFISSDKTQQYSLQGYAKTRFRLNSESVMTKIFTKASMKRKDVDNLWSWSKDTLKKPLLKRTYNRDDVKKLALHAFSYILLLKNHHHVFIICLNICLPIQKYMSSHVLNDDSANYSLCTQWILSPAQRNKYLREEIYCQIVKQLTNNPDKTSADRGWCLLTMLSSLTPPSSELIDHILLFVKGSSHPMASHCETNIKMKRRRGGDRLYPSHQLEHEMVSKQQQSVKIQVFLPDKTTQVLDVTSHTRIFDLKKEIASRLSLKSFHEYSLFLTSKDKVHCLSDRSFYFDCLAHAEIYWFKESKRNDSSSKALASSTGVLVMLKKIWVNGQPCADPVADRIFHFPQEMANYLRGYHQIPDTLVMKLASLVYIALYAGGEIPVNQLSDVIPKIMPTGYLNGKKISEIETIHQEDKVMTSQDAKTVFIRELSRLATYGAVFCEVKQSQVKTLPTNCLMAINYSGVHIIDAKTKEIVKTYKFESIPNWAYDDRSFTLIVVESGKSTKLLMETTVGHNMDDLLMSYVAWIMNVQMQKKSGYQGGTAGESVC